MATPRHWVQKTVAPFAAPAESYRGEGKDAILRDEYRSFLLLYRTSSEPAPQMMWLFRVEICGGLTKPRELLRRPKDSFAAMEHWWTVTLTYKRNGLRGLWHLLGDGQHEDGEGEQNSDA